MRTIAKLVCVLTAFAAATVLAQSRPNFSGTWVAEPAPAAVPGQPAAVAIWGAQFGIEHSGETLTLTRTFLQGSTPVVIRHVLDGSEVTSRVPGRLCEPDSGGVWTAAWEENKVAITMVGAVAPNGTPVKMDLKTVLHRESEDVLRIEQIVRLRGQEPRTRTTIYKRASSAPPPAPPAMQRASATIAQVAWIAGNWIGGSGTSTVEERWTQPSGRTMLAVSRSVRDNLMNTFEFLCIAEREGGLVYTAMPNGRTPATDFTLTQIDAESATFENPAHDYPKMIRYTRKPDGTIEAVISGEAGQRARTFVFKRE